MHDRYSKTRNRRAIAARTLAAIAVLGLITLAIAASCGPFGDDDDSSNDPNQAVSRGVTSPTAELVIETFTATAPGSTPEEVVTQQVRQTEFARTATANPDATRDAPAGLPTPSFTIPPEDLLTPPLAFLYYGDERVNSNSGAYTWLWDDAAGTFFRVTTPFYEVTPVSLTVPRGGEVSLVFEELGSAGMPREVQVTAYDYTSNNAIPTDPNGNTMSDEPVFSIQPGSIKHFETTLQPNNFTFNLNLVPDHYILFVRADWGTAQELYPDRIAEWNVQVSLLQEPLYVTYAISVFVE